MHRVNAVLIFTIASALALGVDRPAGQSAKDFTELVDGVPFLMKAIPGGEFRMGCGRADMSCASNDTNDQSKGIRQQLTRVDDFFLAETEATWELYSRCIAAGACADNTADGGDNGWGKGSRPVIEVSWDDVTGAFLPWLNRRTGKRYRLPTEAEWEFAARAGSTSRYPWGASIRCDRARYGYSDKRCGAQAGTVQVKSFPPNALGLYDMIGNVWEFVADCWDGAPSPGAMPPTVGCVEHVLRGGSWLNGANEVTSAARFRHDRRFRESGDGFRLAMSAAR